ncbi:MAG: nuclear transport factor 2 family protein [Bacteroidetes bacterium]|nr:nuclear transport factor 2 family protein [Bacteroidota bacterium]
MNPEKEILKLETELLDVEKRKDVDFLRMVIADDFIEKGSSGKIYDKEETIKSLILSAESGHFEYEITDFEIIEKPGGSVTALYRININGNVTLRKSVWKKSGTSWRIHSHEGTPLPD